MDESDAVSPTRTEPPGQAISTATQELLRLAEANAVGVATLDAVNDLQLKSVDVVEASMRLRVLRDSLREFNCIHSPTFTEQVGPTFLRGFFATLDGHTQKTKFSLCVRVFQFAKVKERMSVQEELDKLLFLVSDQSLSLLPEYHQRIKVW